MKLPPIPPNQEQLVKIRLFKVDPNLGKVYGIKGKEIGWINKNNKYCYVTCHGKGKWRHFKRANIVWLAVFGRWPTMELDHRNRSKTDDSIGNLREATLSMQRINQDRPSWWKISSKQTS